MKQKFLSLFGRRKSTTESPGIRLLLAPVWLAAFGRDGVVQTWRIVEHWDGRRSLRKSELPNGRACFIVLDGDLPYRRKLQRLPADQRSRQALLRAAPDEFPLHQEEIDYALGLRQEDGYLYALPQIERQRLYDAGLNPAAILVASGSLLNEATCFAALDGFDRMGAVVALGAVPRMVRWGSVRNFILGFGAMIGLVLCIWVISAPRLFDGLMEWYLRDLRREAGDLPRIYQASENMIATQKALAELRSAPGAKVAPILVKLMNTIPDGVAIRRIEISEGILRVAGDGIKAQPWLLDAGFPENGISVEQNGTLALFRAELTL